MIVIKPLVARDPMTYSNDNQLESLKQRIAELEEMESHYTELQTIISQLQVREQATIDFQNKLKILNEVSIDLDRTASFDELCRLAIEFGMEKLGFDRLSLWFVDEKREWMLGTFGVDEKGNIRDERGERFKFAGKLMFGFYDGTKRVVIKTNADLLDFRSRVIGKGWHIAVPLLDGDEFVGLLTADNWINKKSIQPYQAELLQLYGSTIGYLAKSKIAYTKVHELLQAIEHSSSSIALLNANGLIEYVNSSFERVLDYSREEVLGISLEFLIKEVESTVAYETIWEILLKDGIWHGEWQTTNKTNAVLNVLVSISAVKDHNDVTTHYVMIQEDITVHKQIEEQRINLELERERIHLLETFITNVAHEFKNPLSIINTKTYLLSRLLDNDKGLSHIQQIDDQSYQLNRMINDMLTMVRLEGTAQYPIEVLNLNRLFKDCIHTATDAMLKKQITFRSDLIFEASMNGDFDQVHRAIDNLLDNAIQYTDEGGTITLQTMSINHQIQILIIDDGIGIDPNELQNIFKPLYRIDEARTVRGTGLGLTIAKKIIEDHHGEIRVESQLGKGTKIIVCLPLA